MLLPKGQAVHESLSTAFTHIEQLVEGLRGKQFSGYCHVSFWEYDGILIFEAGNIVNGIEEVGMRTVQTQTGHAAITSILERAHDKDGEISVHQLPAKTMTAMLAAMNATPKYKELSTDLTSLDKVIALLQKERLSGFIEVLLENEAGVVNLFFTEGKLTDILLAPPENQMIGESSDLRHVEGLCQRYGAVFNVYQSGEAGEAGEVSSAARQDSMAEKTIPPTVLKLFEAILKNLEVVTDSSLKTGAFQLIFIKILPQVADSYAFFDPFIGDFRYANQTLSYDGDATYGEFVDGMGEVINRTLTSILTQLPKETFLPQLSKALESVSTRYPHLIEQLNLETRLPEIFQDYSFSSDSKTAESRTKGSETRKVLNLQGVGVSDIGSDNILREFYRVISLIAKKYVDPRNNIIQYTALKRSHEFQQFHTLTAFLQQFDLFMLSHRYEKLAFWLNLYNFLVLDGILEFNIKTSVQDEKGFFSKTSYRLGEYLFSLDDIEHGILRNNQRRPYSLFRQFSGSDARKEFCVTPPDSRVHCCFACGAKSGPALVVYTPKNLQQKLNQAARRYLLTNGMRIDQKKRELWLSRSFYWYRKDFEGHDQTLLDFVIHTLKETNSGKFIQEHRAALIIRFMDYDWSVNGI